MECLRLLFDHLAWIEHQFLSGIRDSRKAGSLWGMMRGVGGVRKLIHQSWLAKWLGLGLGLVCWGFKGVQQEISSEEDSTLQIGSVAFPPVHNSILVTDYLTKMGIKTVPLTPYSPDLAPSDFWLFPKLRSYRYETIEEMKRQVHCNRRRLLRRGLEFHVCTINKSDHTKKSLETYCVHLVLKKRYHLKNVVFVIIYKKAYNYLDLWGYWHNHLVKRVIVTYFQMSKFVSYF